MHFLVTLALLLDVALMSPEGGKVTYLSNSEDTLTSLRHECLRECTKETRRKKCKYHFKVEWYSTMSKACFDCPFNLTDCARPHCVAADGFERAIVTVNRMLPGPSIQVCAGDEVIVDVENDLTTDSTSIHWHGLHMLGTPYMDGVPMLTQCPILASTTFRYHFLADQAGTHYWHSHSGYQRTDGMFGSLVIRSPDDAHKQLYDVDDPSHIIIVTDWMNGLGIDKFVNHHHTEHDNKPYQVLINGRGAHEVKSRGDERVYTPLYEMVLQPGKKHRIRTISNSIQNCPFEISIDEHMLLIIASDGQPLQPLTVDSLIIYGGERWDFVVDASRPGGGVFWLKVRGLLDCDERFKASYQLAVLRYGDAPGVPSSLESVDYEATRRAGMQVNTLNAPAGNDTYILASEIKALNHYDVTGQPDHKFFLELDFYSKDNELYHHKDYYPFFGVNASRRLYVPQVNEISFKVPNAPLLSQMKDVDEDFLCNRTSFRNCQEEFCYCGHTLKVEKDSLVEVVLVDRGLVYWANHPFHLHGHVFYVLGMDRLGERTSMEAIKKLDEEGKLKRNFQNPVAKDTVTVPDGGYTVFRFKANNPGFWFFHCHLSFHGETGMGLVFQVGDHSLVPPTPPGFPTCGHWKPEPKGDLRSEVNSWLGRLGDYYLIYKPEEFAPDRNSSVTFVRLKDGKNSQMEVPNSFCFAAIPTVLSIFLMN